MSWEQWIDAAKVLRANWPHSDAAKQEAVLRVWFQDVRDLEAAHVAAGIRALIRDGREHVPNGGQIRGKVAELMLDPPEWGEVLYELRREWTPPRETCEECGDTGWLEDLEARTAAPCSCYQRREEAIAHHLEHDRHPLIAAFAEYAGADADPAHLRDRENFDGSDEARLRMKWEAFARRSRRNATYRGLPSAGLRALERANGERPGELTPAGDVIRQITETHHDQEVSGR